MATRLVNPLLLIRVIDLADQPAKGLARSWSVPPEWSIEEEPVRYHRRRRPSGSGPAGRLVASDVVADKEIELALCDRPAP